jgi:hypothetical protein
MNLFKKYYSLVENQEIINENIYGNKAIIYHRTSAKDLINKVYDKGFQPGDGDTYGKGFYGTYDMLSQIIGDMEKYGETIVKFAVNSVNNFLFLDYKEFIKSPLSKKINWTPKTFIIDQMKYFGFDKIDSLDKISLSYEFPYTSDIAQRLFLKYGGLIYKIIDGMVFTGRNDGKVLVCYNTDLLVPLSYSKDDGQTWIKADKNINYLKKIFSQNTQDVKFKNIKDISNIDPHHWIYKTEINKKSKYYINSNHYFIWIDGTFLKGTWIDGIWKDGTWKYGTWKKGIWENGTWEDGIWERGTWYKGTWKKGTWKDGTWNDGTWEKGTWKRGTWYNGDWEKGTWEDGDWFGGIWWDGTWKNGYWLGGEWLGGEWLGGYDRAGIYHQKGDSPDQWIKNHWIYKAKVSKNANYEFHIDLYVIWKSGDWFDGVWRGGTWENGTWHKGTWEGGAWLDGTWLGGYDKNGNFHPKGDSPDKWNI